MLVLPMPAAFAVGEILPCQVNGADTTVTWVDDGHLRLGDGGLRIISRIRCSLQERVFVCHDAR